MSKQQIAAIIVAFVGLGFVFTSAFFYRMGQQASIADPMLQRPDWCVPGAAVRNRFTGQTAVIVNPRVGECSYWTPSQVRVAVRMMVVSRWEDAGLAHYLQLSSVLVDEWEPTDNLHEAG